MYDIGKCHQVYHQQGALDVHLEHYVRAVAQGFLCIAVPLMGMAATHRVKEPYSALLFCCMSPEQFMSEVATCRAGRLRMFFARVA